jgi:hypothetical protein
MAFYIFNNPGLQVGYIASQFAQGARLAGFEVSTNVESLNADGRFCTPNLHAIGVTFREQPSVSDIIIIDDRRYLSKLPDLGDSSFEYYKRIASQFRTVFIYCNDDVNFITIPPAVKAFLPHQLIGFSKNPHAHCVPWGFSLEGFELARKQICMRRSRKAILMNFNPTYAQTIREAFFAATEELLKSKFDLDCRNLHDAHYAQQLKESSFALALGGAFHWPKSDYAYVKERMSENEYRLDSFPGRSRTVGLVRWDSFRFWETMAFGCVPIQLDFELYGFSLPKIPVRWTHYIPVDLANISATLERLLDILNKPEELDYLKNCAQEWAFSHGHPITLFNYISARL